MHPYFLSCDWGTSSFRLVLVERESQDQKAMFRSDQGVKPIFQNLEQGRGRKPAYLDVLTQAITDLSHQVEESLYGVPIIASGMVSSSIGMIDLPYANLPFSLDGKHAVVEKITQNAAFPHDISIISGLRTDQDVMRGEETQLIGLQDVVEGNRGLVILPGTHSKHVEITDSAIRDFRTYMTGEIFAILQQYSILSASVSLGKFEEHAFKAGVQKGLAASFLSNIFQIRAKQILQGSDPVENYYYLSGLCIGEELGSLKDKRFEHMYLVKEGKLGELYELALQQLEGDFALSILPKETVQSAIIKAHAQFLNL